MCLNMSELLSDLGHKGHTLMGSCLEIRLITELN